MHCCVWSVTRFTQWWHCLLCWGTRGTSAHFVLPTSHFHLLPARFITFIKIIEESRWIWSHMASASSKVGYSPRPWWAPQYNPLMIPGSMVCRSLKSLFYDCDRWRQTNSIQAFSVTPRQTSAFQNRWSPQHCITHQGPDSSTIIPVGMRGLTSRYTHDEALISIPYAPHHAGLIVDGSGRTSTNWLDLHHRLTLALFKKKKKNRSEVTLFGVNRYSKQLQLNGTRSS